MAAVSISPNPAHFSAMSTTRRVPLSSNPNAANSPLRASGASLLVYPGSKLKSRSHAEMMREEAYGQAPPAKRQMVEHGVQRSIPSPTRPRPKTVVHRAYITRAAEETTASKRTAQSTVYKPSEKELENIRQWQTQTRARFPKMVFYFESIPDDQRAKLAKQVTQLGAVSYWFPFLRRQSGELIEILHSAMRNSSQSKSHMSSLRGPSPRISQHRTKACRTQTGRWAENSPRRSIRLF